LEPPFRGPKTGNPKMAKGRIFQIKRNLGEPVQVPKDGTATIKLEKNEI